MAKRQADLLKIHRVPFDGGFSVRDASTKPPKDSRTKDELQEELDELVGELDKLQRLLYADERLAVLAIFQAMDDRQRRELKEGRRRLKEE